MCVVRDVVEVSNVRIAELREELAVGSSGMIEEMYEEIDAVGVSSALKQAGVVMDKMMWHLMGWTTSSLPALMGDLGSNSQTWMMQVRKMALQD